MGVDSAERRADTKEARLAHPSGLLALTRHDSIPIVLDSLLDLPPGREVTQTELAEHAGVTRQSVWRHVDRLCTFDVLEPVPDTSPQRYRRADSPVVTELFELNSALNAAVES